MRKKHNYHREQKPRGRPDRTMTLTFCNEYSSPIYLAIAYYNPSQCANSGNWTKIGWYSILPSSCRVVVTSYLASVNSNWLYYAFSSDKTAVWAGNYFAYVDRNNFNMCWNEPSFDPESILRPKVGFKLFNIGSNNSYTIRLHR